VCRTPHEMLRHTHHCLVLQAFETTTYSPRHCLRSSRALLVRSLRLRFLTPRAIRMCRMPLCCALPSTLLPALAHAPAHDATPSLVAAPHTVSFGFLPRGTTGRRTPARHTLCMLSLHTSCVCSLCVMPACHALPCCWCLWGCEYTVWI
jgi:hypothetical protein